MRGRGAARCGTSGTTQSETAALEHWHTCFGIEYSHSSFINPHICICTVLPTAASTRCIKSPPSPPFLLHAAVVSVTMAQVTNFEMRANMLSAVLQVYITHHTSHITHHTSHITHHTSHITHHTSHITHLCRVSLTLKRHAFCRRHCRFLRLQRIPLPTSNQKAKLSLLLQVSPKSKCKPNSIPLSRYPLILHAAEHTAHLFAANRYTHKPSPDPFLTPMQLPRPRPLPSAAPRQPPLSRRHGPLPPQRPVAGAARRSSEPQLTAYCIATGTFIVLQAVCGLRAALDVEGDNWRSWVNLVLLLLQVDVQERVGANAC
jgi:hypothetical protein